MRHTAALSICWVLGAAFAIAAPNNPNYYLVLLRRNPLQTKLSDADSKRLQDAHMANIHAMADKGVLVAAGPFDDSPSYIAGLFLFRAASRVEAQSIADQDPTIIEKRNTAEVYPWLGPPAIGDEYSRLHRENPATPEGMGVQPMFLLYRGEKKLDNALTKAHGAYISRLAKDGLLGMSGPILDAGEMVEFIVLNRMPDEEAAKLLTADPAIQAGALRSEYHRWFCAEHVIPGR